MLGYGEGGKASCSQHRETGFLLCKSPCMKNLESFAFLLLEKKGDLRFEPRSIELMTSVLSIRAIFLIRVYLLTLVS